MAKFDTLLSAMRTTDTGTGAVDSVNGATGVVVLDQDDVGDGTTYKQYSATEKTKLSGIASGAEVNVNADWNSITGDSEILNKPTIPTQYTDELAQDAVGNVVGNGLDYDDTTGAISVDETELTHNSLGSKQGGTAGEYYHLTSAQHTVVGNTSGTNTGDNATNTQYSGLVTNATHTGDVTGSGALTIATGAVTLAKMADMATASLIYRKTALTGVPEVNTLATLKTDLGLTGTNSGDQTNIAGNAATVTTNANLTGPITSVGNATSIASQTGTGTTFAMDTSPSFTTKITTPHLAIGSATGENSASYGADSVSGNPGTRLEVTRPASGGAAVPLFNTFITNTDSSVSTQVGTIGVYGNTQVTTPTSAYIYMDASSSGAYNSAAFKLTDTGEVGIGLTSTTEPSQKLHVVGNGYFTGALGVGTSTPGERLDLGTGKLKTVETSVTEAYFENTGVRMKNIYTGGGWSRGLLTYEDSSGTDYFSFGAFGSGQTFTYAYIGPAYNDTWMVLRNTNVGIGDASPEAKLDVFQGSTTAALPVLQLEQADVSEEFIQFESTVGAGNPIDTAALGTYYGKIRISVNGTFKFMALYNT